MSENKRMRFHITITDNETGETLLDSDACVILGAINTSDKTHCIRMAAGNIFRFAETLLSARRVSKEVEDEHPEVGAMALLLAASEDRDQAEENEETENN